MPSGGSGLSSVYRNNMNAEQTTLVTDYIYFVTMHIVVPGRSSFTNGYVPCLPEMSNQAMKEVSLEIWNRTNPNNPATIDGVMVIAFTKLNLEEYKQFSGEPAFPWMMSK